MPKKLRTFILLLALIILIGGAYVVYHVFLTPAPDMPEQLEAAGEPFTDFRAEDQTGNPVYLSDLIEGPAILYFWTSWCRFCVDGFESLRSLHEIGGDSVQVLAVNLPLLGSAQNELENGRALMAEHGFSFPSVYDVHGEAQAAYHIPGVPMTLFIDSAGNIVHTQLGRMTLEALTQITDQLS